MKTGRRDLDANRWEPFIHTIDFAAGVDWTTANYLMQVRATKDAGGSALVDLTTVGSVSTQGVNVLGSSTVDGVLTTSVSIRINEATMEGLPEPAELGDDLVLYWDMQVTPSGGNKMRILEGKFTVKAGVTH